MTNELQLREYSFAIDAEGDHWRAIGCYEHLVAVGHADVDVYLSLAFRYFEIQDFGFIAHHQLPWDVVSTSWDRSMTLLDEASEKFGDHPDIVFWRAFFNYIVLGGPDPHDTCLHLIREREATIPFFFLFVFNVSDFMQYREQAIQVMEEHRSPETAKNRYVVQLISSKLERTGGRAYTDQ